MVSLNIQRSAVVGGNHYPLYFVEGSGVRFYLIIFSANLTTCSTGRSGCSVRILTTTFAEYLEEKSGNSLRLNNLARASSSLPYVSKIINIDDKYFLDGGIVDSIPILRSIETGHTTNIVISTRNKGWRDNDSDHKQPKFIYRNYPRLRVALSRRVEVYNHQLDLLDDLEEQGKVIVIRPQKPIVVGRMEKDIDKLENLYEEGFLLGEQFIKENLANLF